MRWHILGQDHKSYAAAQQTHYTYRDVGFTTKVVARGKGFNVMVYE